MDRVAFIYALAGSTLFTDDYVDLSAAAVTVLVSNPLIMT